MAPMTGTRQKALGDHPNSLASSNDPEIRRRIREGRAEYNRERLLFEKWAIQGFSSSIQDDSE